MKTRINICNLLLVTICIMMASCSPKSNIKNSIGNELYRINVGGKYGFIDECGNIVIEPQFDVAWLNFIDSLCFVGIGEHVGFINQKGEFLVELNNEIDWAFRFKNGKAICTSKNGKKGVVNIDGDFFLPTIYKEVFEADKYGYNVKDSLGKMGFIDQNGQFIIPCKYDKVYGFTEGLALIAINNKYGYMDTLGNLAIDTIYDEARIFGNGLARVKKDGKWMFIDNKGNAVETLKYDKILTGFDNNRAFVMSGNVILLIDKMANTIKEIEADSVFNYEEGYATFIQNGKYGKIDTIGNVVIPAKYDNLSDFMDGFSSFTLKGKKGLIDTTGSIIVEAVHNWDVGNFKGKALLYGQDSLKGDYPLTYYDKHGTMIWKDMPGDRFIWPKVPTKEDYIAYFDTRLNELDPIEGVYYVTFNEFAVNRDNDHSSSNGTESRFVAILPSGSNKEGYFVNFISSEDPYRCWTKKFVSIGESNTYAVVNSGKNTNWAEDGTLILEDPYKFEVTLRQGGNNYYNWYVQCEFIKDYPSASEYNQMQQAEWEGTGFAIADGFLVTNHHVIKGAKSIRVKGVNGEMDEQFKGCVVASDKQHDLAIIRIVDKDFKGFDDIPYCIGKSIPEVGDDVFVLGYPMTNTMGENVKLTNGIISSQYGFKGDESMYQISVPVQPGNSGGPLFDQEGNVIGIVCAKHTNAENANYAIKVSYLYSLVNSSGLGIKMSDNNKVKTKSLSQTVKQVKSFVYLIECSSH